ncbi:MAG: hypothetical protein LIO79_05445 [Rikenellaceae bacterium]|nr:hypothetical protein [Rikenellaceae bacterium]
MAQLSSVIGSILRDIISAQHEANLYSLALSESYGKDGKVKDFQLPNVVVSDMELELKYGVKSANENQQQFNIRYSKFREFLKELCEETSKVVIRSVMSTVLTADLESKKSEKHFFERLQAERTLFNEFRSFLSRNMRNAFRSNLYDSVDSNSGLVKTDVVLDRLMDVVHNKFLYETDLDGLFSGQEGEAMRELAEKNVMTAVLAVVEKLSKGNSFKKLRSFPQLDVAITSDELMNMPEESIHTFKLKFSPRGYSITHLEEDEAGEAFVMQ